MKKYHLLFRVLLPLVFIFFCLNGFSQRGLNKKIDAVVAEGKLLYRCEMASWNGTDLFMEKFPNKELIGGYFSYPLPESDSTRCIFYSKGLEPDVLFEMTFDESFLIEKGILKMRKRSFSRTEKEYYIIRELAVNEMSGDTLFKSYQNTNFNLIPLIEEKSKKVFVLTGPKIHNVVIFGNDYLLEFNKNNKLIEKKALHKNMIPLEYGNEGQESLVTVHSHLPETGHLMTSTDICTLMLYSKYAGWDTHHVVSEKYLNIWSCKEETLNVIEMDVIQKINEIEETEKAKEGDNN